MKINKVLFITVCSLVVLASSGAKGWACFFVSDCPPGTKCVTKGDSSNGVCQAVEPDTPEQADGEGSDAHDGSNEGVSLDSLTGNTAAAQLPSVEKTCNSDLDCRAPGKCVKLANAFTGTCKGDMFEELRQRQQAAMNNKQLNPQATKQCLMDIDCGLGVKCIQSAELTVYGVCEQKNVGISTVNPVLQPTYNRL